VPHSVAFVEAEAEERSHVIRQDVANAEAYPCHAGITHAVTLGRAAKHGKHIIVAMRRAVARPNLRMPHGFPKSFREVRSRQSHDGTGA
jgi:hypothetical protein